MENEILSDALKEKFWLVSADMGYGHRRAIYPLKFLSVDAKILIANTSPGASRKERRIWKQLLIIYEFMSRGGSLPLIGTFITRILDSLLRIPKHNLFEDKSNPTLQVKFVKLAIRKGLCSGILKQLQSAPLQIITSFYATAIAAEMSGYKSIYCIICDSDLSRGWVPENSSQSGIIYFAAGTISAQRLRSYGVPEKNILLTGFPLPLELIGSRDLNILKTNLRCRLRNLDPRGVFTFLYKHSISAFINQEDNNPLNDGSENNSFTITYAIGGAGAQKEIGKKIAKSLLKKLDEDAVKLNLVAGTRIELRDYFNKVKKEETGNNKNVNVIWANDTELYFDRFNKCLQTTDVLWTKPSELSFYCALGIPIIMTPAIGPQEKCNQRWLCEIGAGLKQRNPEDTEQWLFDLLNKGQLAEAAWNGFLKGRKYGTFNILDFLETGTFVSNNDPFIR